MEQLGERIRQLRKKEELSQSDLAEKVGISYAQIGRYETKGVQPPAEVLNRIADSLKTTTDYLINGSSDEKAKASIKDSELLKQFTEVDSLPPEEKNTLVKVISAFVRDYKAKQAYA